MNRASLAFCLFLLCGLSVVAQEPKLDIATPQPPAVIMGNGTDAQQVMRIVGGKGGNSPDTSGHPGAGSMVLIQAGDGGDGASGMGTSGAGGSIILLPGAPGSFGDISGAAGGVGIGTSSPQKMLSVRDGVNIDQANLNNGLSLYPGLSFGSNSGSGIASARSGANPLGLDLYTNFTKRISITSAGAVTVFGTLTKGGGSFKIDHPIDPENKYLSHSFVESPDMKNIYDGVARLDDNGDVTVELPEWFEALNEDFRYQLTAVGKPSPSLYVAEEIHDHQFKISGGSAGAKVSWQVTGIRHDAFANAHRVIVEESKSASERGTLLYPREHQMNAERKAR
ncbi:MAG TPA: hypothetical protein VGS96_11995 [Thermoanaerobaculia bacterium]|jgi:hypothetical protein|nr:hypothetical protein [Thermoanaerobaculia bacterium]